MLNTSIKLMLVEDHKLMRVGLKSLFEEKDGDYFKGHTSNYIMVNVKTNKNLSNKIELIEITNYNNKKLIGSICKR